MYLKFYSLREAPFGVTPDPAFLYLSPSHQETLASLLYGVGHRKGFVTIIGEVGCGKTTILKALLNKINADLVKVVYLFDPELSFANLIRTILGELGLDAGNADLTLSVQRLHHYLIEKYRQGKHVVLIVDEAHRMPVDTLERLRMLSNLETAKDKLLQIVLCGQPEFEKVLADYSLRQLRERVAIRATIRPLSPEESLGYIKHRLGRASYGVNPVFSPGALSRIVRYAKGNPRAINIVCDGALVAGYADQQKPVSAKTVNAVIAGLESKGKTTFKKWVLACAAGLLLMAGTGFVFRSAYQAHSQKKADFPVSAQAARNMSALKPARVDSDIVTAQGSRLALEVMQENPGKALVDHAVQDNSQARDADGIFASGTIVFPELHLSNEIKDGH
jgi:general secretion pathway protein A